MLRDIKKYEAQTIPAVEQKFNQFPTDLICDNNQALYDWSSKQTYIALGNMMTTSHC